MYFNCYKFGQASCSLYGTKLQACHNIEANTQNDHNPLVFQHFVLQSETVLEVRFNFQCDVFFNILHFIHLCFILLNHLLKTTQTS